MVQKAIEAVAKQLNLIEGKWNVLYMNMGKMQKA